ncbi:MAG: heavy metal translocating P-type ATPase [Elainellaceae cyanobacterium]
MQTSQNRAIASSQKSSKTSTINVGGMKCAGCVQAVENQLKRQSGVTSATVNLVTELATVDHNPDTVSAADLAHALTESGFPSEPRLSHHDASSNGKADNTAETLDFAEKQRLELQQRRWQLAIASILLVFSAVGHLGQWGWVKIPILSTIEFHWGLATLALLGPGRSIVIDGWKGLWRNSPNMNTLVGLGMIASYTASVVALGFPSLGWECFFDEPVMLVGFILLGRTLEQQARGKAASALQSLVSLQPSQARLLQNQTSLGSDALSISKSVQIPVERVQIGQWLQVLPGEKIPVDGEVVAGHTTVNEAMLTGEPMPIARQPGEPVIAGSINQSGAIAIKTTQIGEKTVLSQIVKLVEDAQARKAPIQSLADTVAGYFTYGVMTAASLTFLFWYFIGTSLWPHVLSNEGTWAMGSHAMAGHGMTADAHTSSLLLSLKLAIAVLVVACPCALGLATPTAILVGSGIGAERGLLIRGGDVLEKAHQLDAIVFDKTGTLTTGQPVVSDCISLSTQISEPQLLQIAATVESGTRHPLADAILRSAREQNLSTLAAEKFYTEPGFGVSADVTGRHVVLGTLPWLENCGIETAEFVKTQPQQLLAEGKTVVYLAIDAQPAGFLAIQDTIRSEAREAIDQLRQRDLRVVLLTGDQQIAAEAVAKTLGLSSEQVLAGVRPDEKASAIAQLQQTGKKIAMVGDGINDAPALAQADIGISLHSGTDIAVEAADIILMRDRLSDVVESIHLSQATFNKIRQNLFWAFAYNVLGIPIAGGILLPTFGILLSPAAAGALMAFSSVSVVTNSLLLRRTFRTS